MKRKINIQLKAILTVTGLLLASATVQASCLDNVVLVHGNTGTPSDWDNTYDALLAKGYSSSQIYRPAWGGSNAAYNNHSGSEETPVRNAINSALSASCTGKIDVIGHSMGVTLAAQQIIKLNKSSQVDAFVGVAGAYRGLWTCGAYPWNVWIPTCASNGLSVSSPFLDWLGNKVIANRVYSIKSWDDQIVCGSGTCTVSGVHSSQIPNELASYTYSLDHFGLQTNTASKQVSLVTAQ
ncbi:MULTISPECIES: alpha/beta fold hydrolase [unclassified Colwellia]|uniref:alpha/beta fold hydrolase n=1 Tax=unclassified Colwellia TaxID=196834 RepID=UPI0015F503FC|nr:MULTISPECIES: alpha/beta fold hydrolase [unclassified Colwellia]MBA6350342.1 lipase [Colwellia sp. BRX8-9]MBA6381415.1 lipase [Colwellia sp. BRX10-9]MBA6395747.1 lipase [Colwellia sp. BRX10-6]